MQNYFNKIFSLLLEQNKIHNLLCPITFVLRQIKVEGNDRLEDICIIIQTASNEKSLYIPAAIFLAEAEYLLESIDDKNYDQISSIEAFLDNVCQFSVNPRFSNKDVRFVIHDYRIGSKPELGYSIKSKLGAKSSLINSNKDATNFIYRVNGISAEQMNEFNSCGNFKEKFNYLQSHDIILSYISTANNIFHNNLTLLDLGIEKIIAEALLLYYSGKSKSLSDTIKQITETDPLNIMDSTDQPMYEYKVKQFLLAFALGMTSAKPWYGQFHANGGYIIVKEDGDIICYHFFDRNDLEEYLYHNTFFDTPSTSRHNFGNIYEENGEYFLKLNLQVRFN